MKWLLLYYDLKCKKYVYRIFSDLENVRTYRLKLIERGYARTTFTYKLYGKCGGFI